MLTFDHRLLRAMAVALTLATPMGASLTVGTLPAQAQAGPEGEVDLETFHRELSPFGKWFEHSRWGEVWRPDVEDGWRPYTRGHWAWTDEHGWYWVAEEEWGWAPFHYGRWVFDDNEEEWLWIPGTEWAPAWVQWRESEDYVGWAPLPPDSELDGGSLRFNQTFYDNPRYSKYWVFAPPALIFVPGLYRHILPTSRHSTVWRSTRHVSLNHRFDRGRIYHPGVDYRRIERWSGRSVPVISLRPVGSARDYGWRRMTDRTSVPVYRPRVVTRPDVVRPTRPAFGGGDRNRDGVPDWRQDRNRDGRPDWNAGDRNRDGVPDSRQRAGDGRPVVVVPGQGRDRNRDGVPDWRQGGGRQSDPATTVRPSLPPATVNQDAGRRAQEDAARRAGEAARQQQQQQQEAARRAAEAARLQQQQQQQEAARRAAEAARRSQTGGAATTSPAGTQSKGDGQRRDGAGTGEGRKRDGEGRGEGRRKREEQQRQQP